MIKPFSKSINRTLKTAHPVVFWLLLLLFFPFYGFSQALNLKFDRLGYEEGLSNNFVICSFQDSKGFLWFGTSYGLNRYDGYTFRIYVHDSKDSNSLSNNWLTDIAEDEDGNLWIATQNGLNKFIRDKEIFIRYRHNTDDPTSISSTSVSSLIKDNKGKIWFGTKTAELPGGLNEYDAENDRFHYYPFNEEITSNKEISENQVTTIYEDSKHNLWVGTKDVGLQRFDQKTKKFNRFSHESQQGDLNDSDINVIFEDSHHNLWVGTMDNGLYLINAKDNTSQNFKQDQSKPSGLASNAILSINEDAKGRIWIGTD